MNCSNCGNEVKTGQQYCAFCGREISRGVPREEEGKPQEAIYSRRQKRQAAPKATRPKQLLIAAVAVILIIGIVIYTMLGGLEVRALSNNRFMPASLEELVEWAGQRIVSGELIMLIDPDTEEDRLHDIISTVDGEIRGISLQEGIVQVSVPPEGTMPLTESMDKLREHEEVIEVSLNPAPPPPAPVQPEIEASPEESAEQINLPEESVLDQELDSGEVKNTCCLSLANAAIFALPAIKNGWLNSVNGCMKKY